MNEGEPEKVVDFDVIVGLIGRGIKLSRTPSMHIAEARAQGGRCDYRILDMDDPERSGVSLEAMLHEVEAAGYAGVNVTYPYKIEVMPFLDELSANATAVGAVNTVIFRDGRRTGHNTDLWGFAESFRRGLSDVNRDHALLIGAGGAGVAVAHGLADCCKVGRLSIHDMDPARARALAEHVSERWGTEVNAVSDLAALVATDRPDGVVNATPMGMEKLPGSAFPTNLLHPEMWIADVVYFPLETELLKAARAVGCRTLSGAGMAVFQAVRAFELFAGRPADSDRMRATFDAFDQ
ncbi:shikimate dehydrogenase [Aliiruegeria lutimaris]|uniref:Shikimate dehydrogenase n=1 Tax=Aliiruegeria lutimaris TaxID=571298 RepID=A0A1G8VQV6_9RHOB|nr:shikimate dehydrogenase [Aliiruegeria lutimaris]SDJ68277.1 shikimate dehydrogenase [Aliiruegeria lutimaris]